MPSLSMRCQGTDSSGPVKKVCSVLTECPMNACVCVHRRHFATVRAIGVPGAAGDALQVFGTRERSYNLHSHSAISNNNQQAGRDAQLINALPRNGF
ncbi:GH24975 [Drosophila grimshawi]|uniref:GH24975 n=1 Tax=Drosophila grimshawi TaxID=7222 RepID=B4K319_DROGR|nr:GH24975 [Drosophila grimshawi]